MLRLDRTHEAAVLEAGSNHPGELAPLLQMMAPSRGVVTNIGREHLEYFGDLAGRGARGRNAGRESARHRNTVCQWRR